MSKEKPLIIEDSPSCEFLSHNMKAEREAIEQYLHESNRSDDLLMKNVFHYIAIDEMKHLELLEDLHDTLGCK